MLRMIFTEMWRGNFPFAILVVGIAQLVVMLCSLRQSKRRDQ